MPAAILLSASCSTADSSDGDPFDPTFLPRIALTELAEIGAGGGGQQPVLNRVTDAAILEEEEIALASNEGEILVFGVTGEFRRRLGMQGNGPGEFRFIQHIVRLDGSRILAWDPALDRATVFTQDGRLDYTCSPPWARSKQAGVFFVGAFPDGRFVLEDRTRRGPAPDAQDGMRSDTIPYLLFDRSGDIVRTIARFVRQPRPWDSASGYRRILLGSDVRSRIVGDELLVGETDSIVLQRWDTAGTARSGLRLGRAPRRLTEADIETAWRGWGEQMVLQQKQMMQQMAATAGSNVVDVTRQEADEAIARAKETMGVAELLPAYRSIMSTADGALWLEDHLHPTDDVSRWFLLDDGFEPVGWIELPPGERLLAAESHRMIVLRKDDLDVESVVVYGGDRSAADG